MPDNDPIKMVEAFFEAWNAQDWDRWAALHTEDVYHAGPDHPHPLVGREAVVAAHKGLGGVFPDFRYDLTRLFANGDLVCAEWVLAATHRGPLPGPGGKAEAAGRPVKVPGCFVLRLAGGQVAEYVGHVDFLGMYTQLGLVPPLSSDIGRR